MMHTDEELKTLERQAAEGDPKAAVEFCESLDLTRRPDAVELVTNAWALDEANDNILQLAADHGSKKAQFCLGEKYYGEYGYEDSEGREKSQQLLLKAAEQGVGDAMFSAAFHYMLGYGIEQNVAESARLYLRSLDPSTEFFGTVDIEWAHFHLGECYFHGWGIEKNAERAAEHYRKACLLGDVFG